VSDKKQFAPVQEQLDYLRKGVAEIIPEQEFKAKLEKSRATGVPLRAKLGVDPTAPDLHLGHTVVIRKLKHFQDLGHQVVFLIGDFTAMVGDPTGQSETRPTPTREQVRENAKTYLDQVFKILDSAKTEVRYNADWLGTLSSIEFIHLCGKYRLARMLEHEDFRQRLATNQPISVHEILYPLLVAYDSMVLKADVELGATEQKFNLLMGREIQREYGEATQAVMTLPILVGLDGQRKMSKSLGNYVGISEPPSQMFGKLMSISDEMMWPYMELLTDRTPAAIATLKNDVANGTAHPMDVKIALAQEIIAGFHGSAAAASAADEFKRVFQERQAPTSVTQRFIDSSGNEKLARALTYWTDHKLSRTEAERLIRQGAVEIDGVRVADPSYEIDLNTPRTFDVRVGKMNFFRITIKG
jgi:tyrosyl-tRNA synthetase